MIYIRVKTPISVSKISIISLLIRIIIIIETMGIRVIRYDVYFGPELKILIYLSIFFFSLIYSI